MATTRHQWIHDEPMVKLHFSDTLTPYESALSFMQAHVHAIEQNQEPEMLWFLEHPPLYTAGTSTKPTDLVQPDLFPVYKTGRGGQYTYHGPGQRVVYVMLDLRKRGRDVRRFVKKLEHWVVATLSDFGIQGHMRDGRVGVWVERPEKPRLINGSMAEDKIAAIGIRLHKWISFHGISINLDPDLDHYAGIVPCGITEYGVTSFFDLGFPIAMHDLDSALIKNFGIVFD